MIKNFSVFPSKVTYLTTSDQKTSLPALLLWKIALHTDLQEHSFFSLAINSLLLEAKWDIKNPGDT